MSVGLSECVLALAEKSTTEQETALEQLNRSGWNLVGRRKRGGRARDTDRVTASRFPLFN